MKTIAFFCLFTLLIVQSNAFDQDINLAEKLGAYSLVAYCSNTKLYNWSCGKSCSRIDRLDSLTIVTSKINSQGMIGYNSVDNSIVIAIRGTVPWSLPNWISDIKTQQTNYTSSGCDNCKVHFGFYEAMQSIFPQIALQFNILKSKYPKSKVHLTGHSLGGAIATLIAPEIFKLNGNKPIDAFYTMGSPRVGNTNFSDWFINNNNFSILSGRVTHNRDPVVQLPPSIFPFSFQHIGNEIFFKQNDDLESYSMCAKPEDRNCSKGVLVTNILDHQSYFDWSWGLEQLACQ